MSPFHARLLRTFSIPPRRKKFGFFRSLETFRFSTPKHTHSANSCLPRERFSSGYTVLSGPRCTKHPRDTVSVFRARRKDCPKSPFLLRKPFRLVQLLLLGLGWRSFGCDCVVRHVDRSGRRGDLGPGWDSPFFKEE